MRTAAAACSYGPTGLQPVPAAADELTAAEQIDLAELLVSLTGDGRQHERLAVAAALRERHGVVVPAVDLGRVRDRLAAVRQSARLRYNPAEIFEAHRSA